MNDLRAKVNAQNQAQDGLNGAPRVRMVSAGESHAGQRLDNFLIGQLKGVPQSRVYRMIRSGEVRVNGGRSTAEHRLTADEIVRVPPVRMPANDPIRAEKSASLIASLPKLLVPILHEDDDLLVINKPAGLAVHGGSGVSHGAIERLRAARPQAKFLELVHRLDRETSGVLLIAKKRSALLALHTQLREDHADKRYHAVVFGRWPKRTKTLKYPLKKLGGDGGERKVIVVDNGQSATTHVTGLAFRANSPWGPMSLVEARLETGRTHQIRVHLSHAGFAIAGDERYGNFELNKSLHKTQYKRMFLHAFTMKVIHPNGRQITFMAPVPELFHSLVPPVVAPSISNEI
jgi:23S rRNA pseudouridine955/2504/2580 synthase